VEVKEEFERYKENLYTVGLERLILSKAQFIFDLPKEKMEDVRKYGQDTESYPIPTTQKTR